MGFRKFIFSIAIAFRQKKFQSTPHPRLKFFNRDPIDWSDGSRQSSLEIVGCIPILPDNYPIIGNLTDSFFSR
jgi:hypothetical protein